MWSNVLYKEGRREKGEGKEKKNQFFLLIFLYFILLPSHFSMGRLLDERQENRQDRMKP